MAISRRGFLTGILALGAAPAICKAENLMKICVPSQELIVEKPFIGRGMTRPIIIVDESIYFSNEELLKMVKDSSLETINSLLVYSSIMSRELFRCQQNHQNLAGMQFLGKKPYSHQINVG